METEMEMEIELELELELEMLSAVRVLGRGAMGTVFLVRNHSCPGCPFALKVVHKSSLQSKFEADRRARWEMSALARLDHPFLPTLLGSTETDEYLAWAIPYCPGGDLNVLRYHQTDRVFSHSAIRFYVAELVCAIDYLHAQGIVYRDLKPENVLVQASGHVMLTDFDLSRLLAHRRPQKPSNIPPSSTRLSPSPDDPYHSPPPPPPPAHRHNKHRRHLTRMLSIVSEKSGLKKAKSARVSPVSRRKQSFTSGEKSNSFVGTEEYVSPEVVRGDGHEFAVDWWALGVLTYEMAYGRTPFIGKNRKETFRNVLTRSPEFVGKRSALTDFISRLLEKDPTKRLGYEGGAAEVKDHAFFRGLHWDLLTEVSRPPFLAVTEDLMAADKEDRCQEFNIKEYFEKQRVQPPSSPALSASSMPSPSFDGRRSVSFTGF
ncbi:hypothetical protein H6P81_008418 [Aristolochia fimbriata]|uniref:non-specific serine/threonine protein kinase n=1 Tax=Aristolochia fimbriata TaxID=158543 RepID=A0AAV7EI58_ARIFI|nr:hypothetical protein H6P81_008418 [Aristolochia fimbriata]